MEQSHCLLVALVLGVGCAGGGGTRDTGSAADGSDAAADTAFVPPDTAGPGPDTPTADTMAPDTASSCSENPGGPFCPCLENDDCDFGYCVFHLGERVCTRDCINECPDGFHCKEAQGFGPDMIFICWSDFPGLCLPCSQSGDCPDPQHRCVLYPDGVGSFCGGACQPYAPEPECPAGWVCQEVSTMEGDQAAQCVLAEGECPCSGTAVTEGLGTHCYALSEVGVCSGWRSCTEGGLTACDAPVPAPEVCWNDVDEDCDGTQDDADECCFPHCEGKVCGSDGCGGSCGDCGDGELCTGEGLCVCVPHCAGLQCGPDGCGGSCGACPPQYACDPEGQCACVPDCAGKDCGSDGCGGSCGGCPINHVCTEAFACLCVPACQGKTCGTDGCGGSCGGCPPGTVCLFGECQEGCNGDGDCGLLEECVGGYCHPDVPDAALLVDAGGLVESVPGQPTAFLLADVTEAGLTTAAGQGPGLVAQAGWGPPGMDPQANPQAWTWVAAAWHADAGAADRYRAKLTEDSPGTRAWTFRFSLDGLHWTYADAEAPAEDYDPTALGTWSVLPPPVVTGVVPPRGTVLGGTTVFLQGKHFADGLTLTLDGVAVTPISVLEDLVTFVTPSHAAGPVDLLVTNPSGQAADLEDGYRFVHVYSPVLDGNLGEWNPLLRVGEGSVASDWNPALNHLDALYAAFDGIYLYVAVAGACEPFNYFLAYVDGDFGAESGIADMLGLSDNDGNGDLDDALSNILHVDVAGFGADHAFGSRGMASCTAAGPLEPFVGWRSVSDLPYDLPWLPGTVACSAAGCEAAFSLAMLYPQGIPSGGAAVALVVKITDRYGDDDGISNQTLPGGWNPEDPAQVGTVATFEVY